MRENSLLVAIAAGVLGGGLLGWLAPEQAVKVAWLGDLFLNALKALVLPLVFCSMIDAVTGMSGRGALGRTARLALGYYVATTLIAVVIGLLLVSFIRPGTGVELASGAVVETPEAFDLSTLARSLIAPNIFEAAAMFQVLPILVFGLALGAALSAVGDVAGSAIAFFRGCNAAMLRLVNWLMWTAPVGVGALIAARLGAAGGGAAFAAEIAAIGLYCLTVISGLLIHALVVLPLILRLFTGRSPWSYGRNLAEALMTAFSTASSSATLAVTMRLSEQRNRISATCSRFVLPLGATVNMDGTALYEAVAAMFIAQAWGIELTLGSQVVIVVTATLASIGAAGIPQAGLVTMVMVLEAVGLPLEGIAAILAVDWFLDRCRTTVNVWGDAVAAAVVESRTDPGAPGDIAPG